MFFAGLTFLLILITTGIVLLVKSVYVAGGILLGIGIVFSFIFIHFYRSKKQGKKYSWDWLDCANCADCGDIPFSKKMDCDCGNSHNVDCHGIDCTPDCSP